MKKNGIKSKKIWYRIGSMAISVILLLSGCSVKPQPLTTDEVTERVRSDKERMYAEQEPITGPITLSEAMARALKYDLDYRLKKMESALSMSLTQYANNDMLPNLLAKAGYSWRDRSSGGISESLITGRQSLEPSTSEERKHILSSAEFSWNLLDFGVSYYRAHQQANQYLIAEERRRKVVQNLLQDIQTSYWRALGAQRLEKQAQETLKKIEQALSIARTAEIERIISPKEALEYQRALLDATALLNQRRQDLAFAKNELAALMNVPPGVDFILAEEPERPLPQLPTDLLKLEEMALLQRPELREEDLKKRITAEETRKQLLSMLPSIGLNFSYNYDSNDFLYHQNWFQAGSSAAWNLLRLVALPDLKKAREDQIKTDEARRMALSMAILTQVRISINRYLLALEDFKFADKALQVDNRMMDYTRASVSAKLNTELEAIRAEARAILGAYQRTIAYAICQRAYAQLYNAVGFDAIPDTFEGDDLTTLTKKINEQLIKGNGVFPIHSNLFENIKFISIKLSNIDNVPINKTFIQTKINNMIKEYNLNIDDNKGLPIMFTLQRHTISKELEKITWNIELIDSDGKDNNKLSFTTTIPSNAQASTYEATLLAAVSETLPKIQNWVREQHN